jgi:hypothetical protein
VSTVPTMRVISPLTVHQNGRPFDGLDYDRSQKTGGIIARRPPRSRREFWSVVTIRFRPLVHLFADLANVKRGDTGGMKVKRRPFHLNSKFTSIETRLQLLRVHRARHFSSHGSSEWAAFDGLDYDRSVKTEGIIARRPRWSRRGFWSMDPDTLLWPISTLFRTGPT